MFEMHYTGFGYPSMEEIEREAKERGFTHSYWASEYGYSACYNGDTVVVFDSLDGMSELMKEDAMKYGKKIETEPVRKNMETRIKMVKAMEFICRQINDEDIFEGWLINGVGDGDIKYGDLSVDTEHMEDDEAYYYCEDPDSFAELMGCFIRVIARTKKGGGLYCDGVVSDGE